MLKNTSAKIIQPLFIGFFDLSQARKYKKRTTAAITIKTTAKTVIAVVNTLSCEAYSAVPYIYPSSRAYSRASASDSINITTPTMDKAYGIDAEKRK
jgi:hypothetical protein